jgi:hypothetical protein
VCVALAEGPERYSSARQNLTDLVLRTIKFPPLFSRKTPFTQSSHPPTTHTRMASEAFSAAEAELYDRQIRLWGATAQKRLQSSSILVFGMNALGAEIAKNAVLAGVFCSFSMVCWDSHEVHRVVVLFESVPSLLVYSCND